METNKLFENEDVYCGKYFNIYQDLESPIPGFFIIESRRNLRSIAEFSYEESIEFVYLMKKLRIGMENELEIKDVYFFQNEDSRKKKFNFWAFPRYKWMEKHGVKIESVRIIMNYAKKNLVDKKSIAQVKLAVKKMNAFMN